MSCEEWAKEQGLEYKGDDDLEKMGEIIVLDGVEYEVCEAHDDASCDGCAADIHEDKTRLCQRLPLCDVPEHGEIIFRRKDRRK